MLAINEGVVWGEYEDDVSSDFLFLQKTDTVQREVNASRGWDTYVAQMLELYTVDNGDWINEWKIESKKLQTHTI